MRTAGTSIIEAALFGAAVLGAVGLTSDLPPADPTDPADPAAATVWVDPAHCVEADDGLSCAVDPAALPTETVTVTVTETVEVPVPVLRAPTHPCHEDEAAIVQPYGLVCVPVDDLQPDRATADRVIAESGRSAYWPSEYTIEPRNAHDTDPGHPPTE